MFDLGPTVEITILVHDLLIGVMFAYFSMSCSYMSHEEHRRVKGRFLYNRHNRNCGVPLGNTSIRFISFDCILDTKEITVKDPDIYRGPLNMLFSISDVVIISSLAAFVNSDEGAFFGAGGVAYMVGPTGGGAISLG